MPGRVEQVGSPAEVYGKPASLFVAGFMGSPAMNLLDATVGPDGSVAFDLAPNQPVARTSQAAGSPLVLGIRPEALRISHTPGLSATVELVEELGGSRIAHCALGEHEIAVVLPPGIEPFEGRRVELSFNPTDLHAFDRTTGERIDASFSAPVAARQMQDA